MSDATDDAEIRLTPDEAIVLFDLLARWIDGRDAATPDSACFESPAECVVLQGALASLETQLTAPFRADYADTVERARARLASGWDGATLRR